MSEMRRFGVALVVAIGVLVCPAVAEAEDLCPMEPVPDATLRTHESELLVSMNRVRADAGRPALASDGRIVDIARRHAARMAAEHRVYHNPSYARASVVGAEAVGEVVGGACSVRDGHAKVMQSPAHRRLLLDAAWRSAGVGIASDEAGALYFVEAFAQPKQATAETASPASPPAVVDPPTAAPRIAPSVAPPPRRATPVVAAVAKPAAQDQLGTPDPSASAERVRQAKAQASFGRIDGPGGGGRAPRRRSLAAASRSSRTAGG